MEKFLPALVIIRIKNGSNIKSAIKNAPFNINSQQDVPEILQVVLDELCGPSVVANDIASSTITSTTS